MYIGTKKHIYKDKINIFKMRKTTRGFNKLQQNNNFLLFFYQIIGPELLASEWERVNPVCVFMIWVSVVNQSL